MRVSSVSMVKCQPKINQRKLCVEKLQGIDEPKNLQNVNFKAKFGGIVGGILGTVAVGALAVATAPAVICLAGAGAVTGALAGSITEDKVNGKDDDD